MKRILIFLLAAISLFSLTACEQDTAETPSPQNAAASSVPETESSPASNHAEPGQTTEHGLTLSDMVIRITSQGHTATFQLYDTAAAKELYEQLPLELELTNFRNAQWMFYPPERLNVTPQEAYHDGVKGELGYYAPWGNAFILYEDFYARDQMHRLGVGLTGIDNIANMSGSARVEAYDQAQISEETGMKISVQSNGNTVVFELNGSRAARELYEQLPLTIAVEDYGGIEKIFNPPEKLGISDTPLANAIIGSFGYYEPWNNVVMFYGYYGSASGLYELGKAVSGIEHIANMSGTIQISKMEDE